jgi:ERCC4-type nuclease
MKIKIDNREHELIRMCKYYLSISPIYKDIELVVEVLPLGDIIICDDKEEKLIIERKSLSDLSSSIKDGRYEEQSYRLNGLNHHNHNIIYLIEGDMNRLNLFKDRIDKTTLYSAMLSLNYYKGFSVLRSYNTEETALIICNMAYKIKKSEETDGKRAFYSNQRVVTTVIDASVNDMTTPSDNASGVPSLENDVEPNYCSVIKKVKKENITVENIGEIMLCQIPGISSVSAIAVMTQYKTIQNLILKLKEDDSCLTNVTYTNTKNQVRKINKTVISNIKKFLTNA